MGDLSPQEICERAAQLGYAARARLDQALSEFGASAQNGSFTDYLLQRGLVTLEQVADLLPMDDMGATVVSDDGDPIVDKVFSECRVQRKLGQGGMGSVYLAERGDELVVVKFLAPEQAANTTWRARFLREAQVMQRIAHENIVAVHGVDGDHERPHIVMEFVDGQPLDERVTNGAVPWIEATRIGRDIALALAHAHAAGVIHRDIKPANVLVDTGGKVKVLDFGLAKSVMADDGLSMPGQVLGTPHYMAPEQWGDHSVDARCDVFSLGAMLYHLVTGFLPFPGKNPAAISRKVLKGVFTAPGDMVELPEDLELVIFRMMDRDRSFRYPNAKQAADDLQRVLDGQRVKVPCLMQAEVRHSLMPGDSFVLGRDETCEVSIADRSVSRQHARIERGKTGYAIHDLGSTYGTFVGGMRVRNVALKDGDEVRLGKISLRFRDGGLGHGMFTTRRLAPDRMRVRSLPLPFVRALIEDGDRRVVVHLLEQLAPSAIDDRVSVVRDMLRLRLGGDLAETVGQGMSKRLRKLRSRIPVYLFTITHENLADDVERWLSWWDQSRPNYPPQLAPQRPAVPSFLEVLRGEPEPRTITLEKHAVFEIGREDGKEIQLRSRSVSRLHATLLRFHQRFVLRDEGSRFGTMVNGEKIRHAFLRPGDTVKLGKIDMRFATDQPDPSATAADEDTLRVDPEAFEALVEAAHPTTVMGLLRFLEESVADDAWIRTEAERLYPKNGDKREALTARVREAYVAQAERARETLPRILGEDRGADVGAWQALVHERADALPIQFLPQGWFAAERA